MGIHHPNVTNLTFINMKILVLGLCFLMVDTSFSQQCTTLDVTPCNPNHPFNMFFGLTPTNPCFKQGSLGSVCFSGQTSNTVKQCDCWVDACNCVAEASIPLTKKPITCSKDDSEQCCEQKKTFCQLGMDNTECKYCRDELHSHNCGHHVFVNDINDDSEKAILVDKHNELRRKVAKGEEAKHAKTSKGPQPPASNMNELVWNDEVAKMAQTWADVCSSTPHDKNRKMALEGYPSGLYCGQNVYNSWSSQGPAKTKNLARAVQSWYDEVRDFNEAVVENFRMDDGGHTGHIGHYSQVVWADVSVVGCGYEYRIDEKFNNMYRETIICTYCKGGNELNKPMYKIGEAASACPDDHPNPDDGLCKE